jgi:hypothetical protein
MKALCEHALRGVFSLAQWSCLQYRPFLDYDGILRQGLRRLPRVVRFTF